MYYSWKMGEDSLVWLFPLFWKRQDGSDYETNVLWIIPTFVTAFKYKKTSSSSVCFLVLLFYRHEKAGEISWSYVWFFHKKACFIYSKRYKKKV